MIDKNEKFLFVRIPKTAGTTLSFAIKGRDFKPVGEPIASMRAVNISSKKESFSDQGEAPPLSQNKSKFMNLISGSESPGNIHHDYLQWINEFPEAKDYFSFTFVRNPFFWMGSMFNFFKKIYSDNIRRLFRGKPAMKIRLEKRRKHLEETLLLFDLTLRDVIEDPNLIKFDKFVDIYFSDDHLGTTQSSFIKNEAGDIDISFVGKFESLQEDWEFVAKKIKREPVLLENINRNIYFNKNIEGYDSVLVKNQIREGLAEDFENFKYDERGD